MGNIDVVYMDDDFNFDNIDDSAVVDNNVDVINADESSNNKSKNDTSVKTETLDENIDLYKETYNIIDNYNYIKNHLKKSSIDLKLLKVKYESLENEYNSLLKKFEKESNLNEINNKEIKAIRKELIEKNKNALMLKTIVGLIIKYYGIEDITKKTHLTEEQINQYLK